MTPCWWLITVWKESQSSMGFLTPNARSGEDKEKRLRKTQVLHHFDHFWVKKKTQSINASFRSHIPFGKRWQWYCFFDRCRLSACHFRSFQAQIKPGQCEPLFVPAGIYGMVSRKVPGAAWCSHLGGSSAGWLNYWCESPSTSTCDVCGRRSSNSPIIPEHCLDTFIFYLLQILGRATWDHRTESKWLIQSHLGYGAVRIYNIFLMNATVGASYRTTYIDFAINKIFFTSLTQIWYIRKIKHKTYFFF